MYPRISAPLSQSGCNYPWWYALPVLSVSGRKGIKMKVKYHDPYEPDQNLVIEDAATEALKEVLDYLNESARLIQNAERRERYHAPINLEDLDYESSSIAYHDTPESIVIRKERTERVGETLTLLTETQLRRLIMQADGIPLRQIAEAEGTSVNAVKECLDAAKKIFRKNF